MTNTRPIRSYLRDGLIIILLGLLIAYLGSFLYLSRVGMQKAEEFDMDSYYFTEPAWTQERQQMGETLCMLYWPLIEIDARYVSGMRPGIVHPVRLINDTQFTPPGNYPRLERSAFPSNSRD
ncbi:hypothetical protein [Blastopirellula marina]|uniref:Uncharacterized protein n=1 Tax=Blastopirellula marina DSM 3645 TaxID=314230 RepID=A3ZRW5_9BACT|nr:hypothetical protein [Blastopirellula marina]EAQ80884.1 hypothetical protein DSM3645_12726 [Blastopirellula marina DSM 3645]